MEKNTVRTILKIIFFAIIIVTVVIIVDYFNLLGMIGIDTSKLNVDFLSLIIGNVIVISLFISTYYIVDQRNIKKENNQQSIAYLTLIDVYKSCLDMVEMFKNDEIREKAVEKVDGSKTLLDNKHQQHWLNYPFENESMICGFASSGIISKEVFKEYLTIKADYQKYINVSIVFSDVYERFKQLETNLTNDIAKAISELTLKTEDISEKHNDNQRKTI